MLARAHNRDTVPLMYLISKHYVIVSMTSSKNLSESDRALGVSSFFSGAPSHGPGSAMVSATAERHHDT